MCCLSSHCNKGVSAIGRTTKTMVMWRMMNLGTLYDYLFPDHNQFLSISELLVMKREKEKEVPFSLHYAC
jgi:hypothetical protein